MPTLPPNYTISINDSSVAINTITGEAIRSDFGVWEHLPTEEEVAEATALDESMEIEELFEDTEEDEDSEDGYDMSVEDVAIIDEEDEEDEEALIAAQEALNAELDRIAAEATMTRAPVYPTRLDANVVYIMGEPDGSYRIICQGHSERSNSLADAWQYARRYQGGMRPQGYGNEMSIYPRRETPEYRYLEQGLHEVIPDEVTEGSASMPAQTRVADGPHVIRVQWQEDRQRYRVYMPYRNSRDFTHVYNTDPNVAHMRAREFAGALRDNDGNPWKVLPRRNTNEWRDLVNHINWSVQEDPANAMAEATRHRLFIESVRQSPSSSQTQQNIEQHIRKQLWEISGNDWSDEDCETVRTALIEELRVATGVTFIAPEVESHILLHPDNVVNIHYGPNHLEEHGITTEVTPVSTDYAQSMTHTCSGCRQRFINSAMQRLSGDSSERYCNTCYDAAGFYNCALCQRVHSSTPTCERYERMPSNTIHNYSMDVRRIIPKMYHMPTDKVVNGTYLRYGVELEVIAIEDRGDGLNNYVDVAATKVGDAMKHHAILKSDSSLRAGGHGFEIVSAPATLEYHKRKMWNKLFGTDEKGNNVMPEGVKPPAAYVKSWTTDVCGIHIHITRAALTKMQLGKLCVFYNEPCNNGFLGRIAGRAVNRDANYCRASKKKLRVNTPVECGDHHDAISISSHNKGKTAEVRIFRGNCSRHGLMRCLEFVDATVHWCAQNGASQLEFGAFLKWFNQSSVRSRYPDLFKHLYQLGYLQTKHKSKGKNTLDVVPEAARIA